MLKTKIVKKGSNSAMSKRIIKDSKSAIKAMCEEGEGLEFVSMKLVKTDEDSLLPLIGIHKVMKVQARDNGNWDICIYQTGRGRGPMGKPIMFLTTFVKNADTASVERSVDALASATGIVWTYGNDFTEVLPPENQPIDYYVLKDGEHFGLKITEK